MSLRIPFPRLLPMTICIMALLLVVKSVALVRAAVPDAAHAATVPATTSPTASAPNSAVLTSAASTLALPSAPPVPTSVPPPEPAISDSERALLLDLRHRSAELDARAAALTSREGVLAAAEKRLTARVDELSALQTKLEALEKVRHDRDDTNWAGLTKLYESMRPRDAATIFNDLDMDVLLQVVDRMKEAKAALVLAAMQPDRARQVTAQLAQMRGRENAAPKIGG
jgi:flagellar motility protein MotE (MotC chaperone)